MVKIKALLLLAIVFTISNLFICLYAPSLYIDNTTYTILELYRILELKAIEILFNGLSFSFISCAAFIVFYVQQYKNHNKINPGSTIVATCFSCMMLINIITSFMSLRNDIAQITIWGYVICVIAFVIILLETELYLTFKRNYLIVDIE